MTAKFDLSARVALAAIVADVDLGPGALSDPAALSNLLSDYLPSAPRETGLLMAAAQADVSGGLREHVAHGMDPATAIRIAAASLEARTAYSAEACIWVTGELAIALGLTTADRLPQLAPPSQRTDVGSKLADRGVDSVTELPGVPPPRRAEAETERPAQDPRVHRKRGSLAAAAAIVMLLAAAGSVALYFGRNHSGGTPTTGDGAPHSMPQVSIGSFTGRRPTVIDFSADGASAVTGIRWSTWSRSRAAGSGTWDHETCVPNCLTGPVNKYPATLSFSGASHGLFTVLKTYWDGQTSTWRYPNSWPQEASVTRAITAQSTPRQVVEAYITAINQRNWHRVWRLGGKKLNASYNQMVAGYRHTGRVVIQKLTTNGSTVTVRTKAYETNGAVQNYLLTYKVRGGVIVAGSSDLLGTSGQQSSGQWTASKLVITPHSLGAVAVGMTVAQASAAAGVKIVEVGDGFGYPNGDSSSGLAITGLPTVTCVLASVTSGGPVVVTPQGFPVGGTLMALKSLYGTRLRYVPAPSTGPAPVPGWVVSFPGDGNLAFGVNNGIVTAILGGKKAMPSTC